MGLAAHGLTWRVLEALTCDGRLCCCRRHKGCTRSRRQRTRRKAASPWAARSPGPQLGGGTAVWTQARVLLQAATRLLQKLSGLAALEPATLGRVGSAVAMVQMQPCMHGRRLQWKLVLAWHAAPAAALPVAPPPAPRLRCRPCWRLWWRCRSPAAWRTCTPAASCTATSAAQMCCSWARSRGRPRWRRQRARKALGQALMGANSARRRRRPMGRCACRTDMLPRSLISGWLDG